MRRRNKSCLIRFTEGEYREVKRKADEAEISIQNYMLNAALDIDISTSEEMDLYRQLSTTLAGYEKQLRGMATNINQMAYVANSQGYVPGVNELGKLYEEIREFRTEVQSRWQSTRRSISERSRIRL